MRIVIIDENAARAAIIEQGLAEAGESDVSVITERQAMAARIESLDPDVILIDLGNPSRDVLEEYFAVSRAVDRPIAMFVDRSDEDMIGAAIDAGVSAYIVDGMSQNRIKPVLDLAVRRFNAFSRLEKELHEARSQLAQRSAVDKAKRILMKTRQMTEPEAYAELRSHAMRNNRRIAEVAESLIMAHELMGGK